MRATALKGEEPMTSVRIATYFSAGLLAFCMAAPPRARADEWNQKTKFTFSQPVEIPGRVLGPGTYIFKLADSTADRNIVEVFNQKENHLYGIFLAIPDYRLTLTGKPIITFSERAANAPEAVKAWFYPGDNYGHEFVYPKVKALELAKANNEAVPAMPNELAANTTKPTKSMNEPQVMAMKKAPLKAENPNQSETEVAQAFPPPATQAAARTPRNLPKTASPLPLIGLAGMLLLAAAGGLRLFAIKMK
jgi:hypothetical protein